MVLALVVFILRRGKKPQSFTPLTSIAFMFVIMGIIFSGSGRWFTYGLIGAGAVLAIVDIIMKQKKK